jgi:hypothetical protein
MFDWIFYVAFLFIIAALILFFLRQRGSYFKPAQMLFILAFGSFSIVILCDFLKNHVIQEAWGLYYTTAVGITAVMVTAVAMEHASYVLYCKGHGSLPKNECTALNVASLSFKGYAFVLLVIAWVLAPWSVSSVTTLWGGTVYSPAYSQWFMYSMSGFLIFVMLYPCGLLMLSSLQCKEKLVSKALAWLSVSWAATGFSLLFFNGYVRSIGYEMIEIGYTMNMFFFAIIAYYFKKTTILEKFFETPLQVLQMKEGEHLVVFYTSKIDKMKIFADYITEGLQRGERVVYIYPDEENTVARPRLKEFGIDVGKHEKEGALVLMGLSQSYLSNGHFDKEKLIEFWKGFKDETKRKGFRNERDLFDLGNLGFLRGEEEKYLEYLREANAQIMDTYLTELRAINVEKLDHKIAEKFKFLTTKSMDLLQHLDRFSHQLGLKHQELTGRTLLLEISPVSSYESLIRDFALEAAANIEPITVFTTRGSAVHSVLDKRENARFFLLTQSVSTPQANGSKEDMLLPAKNTSLLLDALDKTLRAHTIGSQNIIFDNLSTLVLSVGFEKTYGFVQYALELLTMKKTTAVFLFSPSAHDSKIASGLQSLFNDQIKYGENGLQIVKLYRPQNVRIDVALMGEVKSEKRK